MEAIANFPLYALIVSATNAEMHMSVHVAINQLKNISSTLFHTKISF